MEAIRKIMGSRQIMQDKAFTKDNLEKEFAAHEYGIAHISTHGYFGGTPDETDLQVYPDDKLPLDDLERLVSLGRFREEPLELMVLSACQTALGDERAALGLGGVAVKAGARRAIATLWSVNDDSTSELLTEFYRNLKTPERMSAAKALQAAQKKFVSRKDKPRYAHPFYWAPFLLIGSWL